MRDRLFLILRQGWWVSPVLLGLAFPPFNLTFLVFAAFVPWLRELSKQTPKGAFWSGIRYGMVFWLIQIRWFVVFIQQWTGSALFGYAAVVLVAGLLTWSFGVLGWVIERLQALDRWYWIPFAWAGFEFLRSETGPLAFPWGLAAEPLWRYPMLIQNASLGEVFLVSAWVVAINIFLERLLWGEPRKAMSWFIASGSALVISIARYGEPMTGPKHVFALAQPGVDRALGDSPANRIQQAQNCQTLAAEARSFGADLVIFPEAATDRPIDFLANAGVPVLFGSQRNSDQKTYQTAFLRRSGEITYADKTRLVLFGETVPYPEFFARFPALRLPTANLTPGDQPRSLGCGGFRVGPLICFEGLFPSTARQMAGDHADLFAIMALDDWYRGTNAIEQLASDAVWRSVENQIPTVRSSSMGISQAVDARGNVMVRIPYGQAQVARVELPVPGGSGAFPGRGLFGVLSLGLSFGASLWPRRTEKRPSQKKSAKGA